MLTREVAEKRGLTDFQNLDNVFDSRIFISPLAEQTNRSINDLLPQPRLLAFTESDRCRAGRPRWAYLHRDNSSPSRGGPHPERRLPSRGFFAAHIPAFSSPKQKAPTGAEQEKTKVTLT